MRSQKDVDNSNRLNETKALILFLLVKSKKYLYISDMAKELGMTNNNVARQMTKLVNYQPPKFVKNKIRKRKGTAYIFRRRQRQLDSCHRGEFQYQFLTPKGKRACKELWIRKKLREIDSSITLNLKKKSTYPKHAKRRAELELEYNQWLSS